MISLLSENEGKALEYFTEGQLGSNNLVKAQVLSSWKKIGELDDGPKSEFLKEVMFSANSQDDVYEWIGSNSIITSEPACWVLSYEDYYSMEQYDSRDVECGAENGFNYKKAAFTINFNGKTYDDCRMLLLISPEATGLAVEILYRIPKGYDGCVLGFHNSTALTKEQIEKGQADPAACLGLIERAEGDLYLRLK